MKETIYHQDGTMEQTIRKEGKGQEQGALRVLAWQCVIALLFCAGGLGLRHWAPNTAEQVRSWLTSQEQDPVSQAVQCFLEDISAGEPVGQAVATFCEELVGGAGR